MHRKVYAVFGMSHPLGKAVVQNILDNTRSQVVTFYQPDETEFFPESWEHRARLRTIHKEFGSLYDMTHALGELSASDTMLAGVVFIADGIPKPDKALLEIAQTIGVRLEDGARFLISSQKNLPVAEVQEILDGVVWRKAWADTLVLPKEGVDFPVMASKILYQLRLRVSGQFKIVF